MLSKSSTLKVKISAEKNLHNIVKILPDSENSYPLHSALRRNLLKVWKTWTGPSRGARAWSRGPKSALSEILQNKEHYH